MNPEASSRIEKSSRASAAAGRAPAAISLSAWMATIPARAGTQAIATAG